MGSTQNRYTAAGKKAGQNCDKALWDQPVSMNQVIATAAQEANCGNKLTREKERNKSIIARVSF
jgi:hypothetical protein